MLRHISKYTCFHVPAHIAAGCLCAIKPLLFGCLGLIRDLDCKVGLYIYIVSGNHFILRLRYALHTYIRNPWVLGFDFGHCLFSSLLDLLLMAFLKVIVQWAALSILTMIGEVPVVLYILGTYVAERRFSSTNSSSRFSTYHCILWHFEQDILLQPYSLMNGFLHLLQFRIKAAVMASSTMCRIVVLSSFLASSQLKGTCVSL